MNKDILGSAAIMTALAPGAGLATSPVSTAFITVGTPMTWPAKRTAAAAARILLQIILKMVNGRGRRKFKFFSGKLGGTAELLFDGIDELIMI